MPIKVLNQKSQIKQSIRTFRSQILSRSKIQLIELLQSERKFCSVANFGCKMKTFEGLCGCRQEDDYAQIYEAILTGDKDEVSRILKKVPFANRRVWLHNMGPLHIAAYYGNDSMISFLIEEFDFKIDAHSVGPERGFLLTPLQIAESRSFESTLESVSSVLLRQKANSRIPPLTVSNNGRKAQPPLNEQSVDPEFDEICKLKFVRLGNCMQKYKFWISRKVQSLLQRAIHNNPEFIKETYEEAEVFLEDSVDADVEDNDILETRNVKDWREEFPPEKRAEEVEALISVIDASTQREFKHKIDDAKEKEKNYFRTIGSYETYKKAMLMEKYLIQMRQAFAELFNNKCVLTYYDYESITLQGTSNSARAKECQERFLKLLRKLDRNCNNLMAWKEDSDSDSGSEYKAVKFRIPRRAKLENPRETESEGDNTSEINLSNREAIAESQECSDSDPVIGA